LGGGGGRRYQFRKQAEVTMLVQNIPDKHHVTQLPFVLVMVLINMAGKSNKYCQK